MELLGYTLGFQLYLFLRRRMARAGLAAVVPFEQNMWVIVGCVFGALAGSKALAFAESFAHYGRHLAEPQVWLGGKTIVGGLLGGWAGVEFAKRRLGIRHSTDAFVFPLILGMCLGRVGCFLTGLADHTHGVHSSLPWAVDFGDGPRHPTQLYEIAVLLALGAGLLAWSRTGGRPNGQVFRLFMLGYLGWRFGVEFIKPRETPVLGLSAIQLACLGGGAVCVAALRVRRRTGDNVARPARPDAGGPAVTVGTGPGGPS